MSDNAREAALYALERCRRSGAWSAETIDIAITKYGLTGREANLASNICLGTLQNLDLCDFYIDSFSSSKIEPKVRDILRTAVYQLLFMDRIPQSAAVNEAVRLCKETGFSRASGFANAVLRKIASGRDSLPEIPDKGTAKHLSIKYSHPLWLSERLVAEKGYAFTESFFAANNSAPETVIQVNTLKTAKSELSAKTECADAGENALRVSGNIKNMYGFAEGLFYVQDMAARCAVSIAELKPYMKVLDACSAPGGKSFAAAVDMENCGEILACDIHEKKLRLVNEGAKRLGIDIIKTEAHDARLPFDGEFDAVIADVPCSGLGVIRKKPDIRFKAKEDIAELPKIQLDILSNVSHAVTVGGTLIYSTCTVLHEENGDVVRAFLEGNNNFVLVPFTLPDGTDCESGMYTFWPNVDGTDGFFVSKLRRKA